MNNNTVSPASLELPVRSINDAPAASRDAIAAVQKAFGFVPNLIGAIANVPAGLHAYLAASSAFEKTSFSPAEQQLILIAISSVNDCGYCVAAHSLVAKAMVKVDPAIVAAVRAGNPVPDAKLDALINLTREIVANRGYISPEKLNAFIAAGYTREQAVEILLGVVQKIISNYFIHLSPVALDPAFRGEATEQQAA
ncbi:carboxymuconolactone decarboxylase family protein [Actomonas aquatica]|uniref:Carboxymuconolactone decarboxylase family protein n=1 Tax=Actomonas aquatica TaxID=2866162 RepID=A0ABZ1C7L0_9BACT|nr:carboxymuconolactone decarboxylase family protein [Opitutus sp. WL0086]WRQ86295.1 carboxymuconolactone decarboxylase family protein [Opitutus sp. WL0086]